MMSEKSRSLAENPYTSMKMAFITSAGSDHSRHSSKTSQSFDGVSLDNSDSLESAAHEAEKQEEEQDSEVFSTLANMASNGLTARQLLGREEQQRSVQRGESMNSTQSSSFRSSLKAVSRFHITSPFSSGQELEMHCHRPGRSTNSAK
jgi:hypothetical protein